MAEIARVGGHYAVQGRSRSLILVSIESNLVPFSLSSGQIVAFDERPCVRVPIANTLVLAHLRECRCKSSIAKQTSVFDYRFVVESVGLSSPL